MIYMHDVSGEGNGGFRLSCAAAWKAGLPDKHRKTRYLNSAWQKKKVGAPLAADHVSSRKVEVERLWRCCAFLLGFLPRSLWPGRSQKTPGILFFFLEVKSVQLLVKLA